MAASAWHRSDLGVLIGRPRSTSRPVSQWQRVTEDNASSFEVNVTKTGPYIKRCPVNSVSRVSRMTRRYSQRELTRLYWAQRLDADIFCQQAWNILALGLYTYRTTDAVALTQGVASLAVYTVVKLRRNGLKRLSILSRFYAFADHVMEAPCFRAVHPSIRPSASASVYPFWTVHPPWGSQCQGRRHDFESGGQNFWPVGGKILLR